MVPGHRCTIRCAIWPERTIGRASSWQRIALWLEIWAGIHRRPCEPDEPTCYAGANYRPDPQSRCSTRASLSCQTTIYLPIRYDSRTNAAVSWERLREGKRRHPIIFTVWPTAGPDATSDGSNDSGRNSFTLSAAVHAAFRNAEHGSSPDVSAGTQPTAG